MIPLPPDETGPVPVAMDVAQPRFFGLAPATALLALGATAVAVGAVLLALGRPVAGAALVAGGAGAVGLALATARRKADSGLARTAAGTYDAARARAGAVVETAVTRAATQRRLAALRADVDVLAARRRDLLTRLGGAAYDGDETAAAALRDEIRAVDVATAAHVEAMGQLVERAWERMGRAKLAVQPTEAAPAIAPPDADPSTRPPSP